MSQVWLKTKQERPQKLFLATSGLHTFRSRNRNCSCQCHEGGKCHGCGYKQSWISLKSFSSLLQDSILLDQGTGIAATNVMKEGNVTGVATNKAGSVSKAFPVTLKGL